MARRRKGLSEQESALADFYARMDPQKLQCKVTQRHVPPLLTDPRKTKFTRRKDGVYQQTWKCVSCGTVVTKLSAPSGYLDDRVGNIGYDHPEDYLNPPETRGVGTSVSLALARREVRIRNTEAARELEAQRKESRKARNAPADRERAAGRRPHKAGPVTGKTSTVVPFKPAATGAS